MVDQMVCILSLSFFTFSHPTIMMTFIIIYIGRVPRDEKKFHLGELIWFHNHHYLRQKSSRAMANFAALDIIMKLRDVYPSYGVVCLPADML